MPITKPAIAWGVRFASATYKIEVDVDGAGSPESLDFPATGSLSTTTDYYCTGDGTSTDLLTMLAATLNTHSGLSLAIAQLDSSFRVICNGGPGITTINLLWASGVTTSLSGYLFGWGADTGAAATVTGTQQPYGLWLPNHPPSIDSRPRQPLVGGVARSVSGLTKITRIATPKKTRRLGWSFQPQDKILIEYATTNGPTSAFEFGWVASIARGYTARYYADQTALSTATYTEVLPETLDDPLTRSDDYPTRWDLEMRLIETGSAGITAPTPGPEDAL